MVGLLAGLCLMSVAANVAGAQSAPERVVSINLCTDQLAMLLAAPGQLVSVSDLARDPRASAMVAEAGRYPANHAGAEEIYLLQPDLVLAGSYSDPATLSMLERLGIRVERFEPAYGLDAVEAGIRHMGALLGQGSRADAMADDFAARRKAFVTRAGGPLAASYSANGYTTGAGSLSGEVILAAGLRNLAQERGMQGGGVLPLELLLLSDPDLLIGGDTYPGASRAEEILHHPALSALRAQRVQIADRDWLCGLPHVLDVVARLAAERQDLE
ncbi:ABC transporter substrate-binding protein [Gemmobacter serpentinus]|uniref:ABC transporter substrate-binding protein n=1 Tax=Gemmobacter serpentinus TaxID=2652247 RepID=UPI00124DBDC8|nr:ABC transporter substrate-binding protein [Gemmobacter serpentinus]